MAVIGLYFLGSYIGGAIGAAGAASAIGAAAGAAAGAALGGSIGGLLGSAVDSQVTFPMILSSGSSSIMGQRIDDFQVQSGSEGSPMKLCIGPNNRIAGTLIYLSPIIEEAFTTEVGGGKGGIGGGGGEATTFYNYLNIAVGLCFGERPDLGLPKARRLKRVWADTKIIYDADSGPPEFSYFDSCTVVAGTDVSGDYGTYNFGASTSPDFVSFADMGIQVGSRVRFLGFVNAANNGYKVVRSIPTSTSLVVSGTSTNETIGSGGVLQCILDRPPEVKDPQFSSIAFYDGGIDQDVDSILEAACPTGECPAYRGTCYLRIERLLLNGFGNRLPQLTALVEVDSTISVGKVITRICKFAFPAMEVDSGAVRGTCTGYTIGTLMNGAAMLDPLLIGYNVGVTEEDGTLVFFTKSREDIIEIDAVHFGAQEGTAVGNTSGPREIEWSDSSDTQVPTEINLTYIDPDRDIQQGAISARRIVDTPTIVSNINLPLVVTANQAKQMVNRLLFSSESERRAARLTICSKFFDLYEGNVIKTSDLGEETFIRVMSIERGANFLTIVEGREVELQTYRTTSTLDDSAYTPGNAPYIPPEVVGVFMDLPALRDEDALVPGFYHSIYAPDGDATFKSGLGYVSGDDVAYAFSLSNPMEGVVGESLGTLADGPYLVWDRVNTVDVELFNGKLEGDTETAVLNGANRLLIGDEIIGFAVATLIGPNQYRLSTLLRGLRDTRSAITTHTTGDRVVLLTAGPVGFKSIQSSAINASRFYKCIALSGDLDAATSTTFRATGATLVQFAPCHLATTRDGGTNDLTITWRRRGRGVTRLFGTKPILANTEEYTLSITDGSIVFTTTTNEQSYVYTGARQLIDFGYAPSSLIVTIDQTGPIGRGHTAEITG